MLQEELERDRGRDQGECTHDKSFVCGLDVPYSVA